VLIACRNFATNANILPTPPASVSNTPYSD
jgi:hypothetical protein